jgi:ATP-dependent Lhr-like helicase
MTAPQPGDGSARVPAAPAPAGPAGEWFHRRFGEPTPVQRLGWPLVAGGSDVLLSAPTGTGKTLAAFLPILGRLADDPDAPGVACLYVAPLRALVNDTARTLQAHLDDLAGLAPRAAQVRVAARTGDTPAAARRLLRTDPPHLLLTTPESLAVLLSQPALRDTFRPLRWAVIDEVHALAPTKRGADLSLTLERLADLAGGRLQRIGLSATATPLSEAARWLAGVGRPCAVAAAESPATPELRVDPLPQTGHVLAELVRRLEPELREHRAVLVFTNTRRLAEQLAWALRRNFPEWDAEVAAHHSSLAAGRRRAVEEAFKEGRLRAVVSSTSLELGIDVGPVDLVVLVHPPGDVIRLLQRVGRSGHGPARVRRGLVLTCGPAELLEAAVTVASGLAAQCEPLHVPEHPLDVLCQHLVGMACAGSHSPDEAFALVRRATPFEHLPREDFDDCLRYLFGFVGKTGPGQQGDRPWLPPRLRCDTESFAILDDRTARLLRRNLGSIVDGPKCEVRPLAEPSEQGEQARVPGLIGEVDELFADRLRPGDRFLLDGRCLEVRRTEPGVVRVDEVFGRATVPRWRGDGWPLSTELASRLFLLRTQASEALREGRDALADLLGRDCALGSEAAAHLVRYFEHQEAVSEVPPPDAALVEVVRPPCPVPGGVVSYCWHTPLNRLGNDALARVVVFRLQRDWGLSARSLVADLGFALLVDGGLPDAPAPEGPAGALRTLLAADDFDADLEAALDGSDAVRSRFAAVAQTGLMLLRTPLGGRRKVGGEGWAARRLYEQVRARDADFVLLR